MPAPAILFLNMRVLLVIILCPSINCCLAPPISDVAAPRSIDRRCSEFENRKYGARSQRPRPLTFATHAARKTRYVRGASRLPTAFNIQRLSSAAHLREAVLQAAIVLYLTNIEPLFARFFLTYMLEYLTRGRFRDALRSAFNHSVAPHHSFPSRLVDAGDAPVHFPSGAISVKLQAGLAGSRLRGRTRTSANRAYHQVREYHRYRWVFVENSHVDIRSIQQGYAAKSSVASAITPQRAFLLRIRLL